MRSPLPTAFTIIDLDSAALAGSATVVHQLREEGAWLVTACRGEGDVRATLAVNVRDDATTLQAALDLSEAERAGSVGDATEPVSEVTLRTGGYLRLQATRPPDGQFALLRRAERRTIVWDSRALQAGDLFACLPLRPGGYALTNHLTQAECPVTVRYPDPRALKGGRTAKREPVRLRAADGFAPDHAVIVPGQGLMVEIAAPARLTLRLRAPDDGPRDLEAWRAVEDRKLWQALTDRVSRARESRRRAQPP